MYILPRVATLRNALLSIFNGSITLIILLIAPLGLAAVIINTLLVTIATFFVATIADRAIAWLEPGQKAELISASRQRNRNALSHLVSSILRNERRRD
ncbi:CRISPR-associated protein Csx18 [Fischerella thermalis]|uniref:CRISPR-associated protein Csx18 n=1 Tax=Fischerella thermalis TaxID=372787 RepID=UPI000E0AFCF7|nr:CRISPR-associated protein Csx18 [Fischerella thermalis]RDH51448.1 hypothetical protein CA946_01175 [Fischerella thermalis 111/344/542]